MSRIYRVENSSVCLSFLIASSLNTWLDIIIGVNYLYMHSNEKNAATWSCRKCSRSTSSKACRMFFLVSIRFRVFLQKKRGFGSVSNCSYFIGFRLITATCLQVLWKTDLTVLWMVLFHFSDNQNGTDCRFSANSLFYGTISGFFS